MSLLIFTKILVYIIIILERYGDNMYNYSNSELAFRIIITFLEGFFGSFYIGTNGFQDLSNKEAIKSIVIGSVASGISGVVNLIKLIIENKSCNNESEVINNE